MKNHILSALALSACLVAGAQESKNLVVTDTDGNRTLFPVDQIDLIAHQDMPAYLEANTLIGATYGVDGDRAQYVLELGQTAPDAAGDPVKVGDVQMRLVLNGIMSENRYEAAIPTGYYRISDDYVYSIDVSQSAAWVRVAEGSDMGAVGTVLFVDGTVDVRREGPNYDIRVEMIGIDGAYYDFSYEGPIRFEIAASSYEDFDADQEIAFDGGQMIFYGNWYQPYSHDATLQLYTGEFDANNQQKNGYWLNIGVEMPHVDDPMSPLVNLVDGTYKVDSRQSAYEATWVPYTFRAGTTIDLWGVSYYAGTYITNVELSGRRMIGLIKDGTLTVSNNGQNIEVNFVTEDGQKIHGTYSGRLVVDNRCDNATSQTIFPPYSSLTADYSLNFTPNTRACLYSLGETATLVPDTESFMLQIMDASAEKGDFFQIVYTSARNGLSDGNYVVSTAPFFDKAIQPGVINFGAVPVLSWFGNLSDVDADGYQTTTAPLHEGTMTVSTEGSVRKFVFNFKDDNGHAITGEFSGPLYVGDSGQTAAPRRAKAKQTTSVKSSPLQKVNGAKAGRERSTAAPLARPNIRLGKH